MSEGMDRVNDEFSKMEAKTANMLKNQQELEKGIGNYAAVLIQIRKTQDDILHIENQKKAAAKELSKYEADNLAKQKKWQEEAKNGNAAQRIAAKKNLANLDAEIQKRKQVVKLLGLKVDKEKENLDTLKQTVKESNKLKAIAASSMNFVKKWGFDKLKEYGIFEMDKEIRNTARSMGVTGKSAKNLRNNLQEAGDTTSLMGVGTKELAKMQGSYSKEIGRSVALSKEGLVAMAEMSEGTGLGEQFAVGMAVAMDNFGGSVEVSRDLLQETVDTARSMGVNSAQASEMLSKNLKFAQKYNFKNGVKGLAKMSTEALKLKLDLEGISGLADKVFRPEGAVEMAAKLQTMGGAFAQMANPMELMFKARNDFAGFAKDIGKATSEFVEYNEETQTFDIKGGLAADRMREIANITGLGVEELQKMAVAQKKIEAIGAVSPISLSDEDKDVISGMAEMNKKTGQFSVELNGVTTAVKDLKEADLIAIRAKDKSLKLAAEESRTAAETLDDIKTSFTQLLIPVADALKEDFAKPLRELVSDGDFRKTIRGLVKGIADFVGGISKFIIENPLTSVVTALTAWGGLKALTWIKNGMMLAKGFNMRANAGGGGGGGGMGRRGKGGGMFRNQRAAMLKAGRGRSGIAGKALRGAGGKFGMGSMGGMAAGLGFGLGGMALDAGRNQMTNRDSGAGKAMGIGSMAMKGAGMGAMLGPWGMLAGGLIGAGYGAYDEYFSDEAKKKAAFRAGSTSGGNIYAADDAIIKFNPKDKFMQVDDALVASTKAGELNEMGASVKSTKKMHHTFDEIKININLNANGMDQQMADQLVDNKPFVRLLNTKLKEEMSQVMSGGVQSPNPKFATA